MYVYIENNDKNTHNCIFLCRIFKMRCGCGHGLISYVYVARWSTKQWNVTHNAFLQYQLTRHIFHRNHNVLFLLHQLSTSTFQETPVSDPLTHNLIHHQTIWYFYQHRNRSDPSTEDNEIWLCFSRNNGGSITYGLMTC